MSGDRDSAHVASTTAFGGRGVKHFNLPDGGAMTGGYSLLPHALSFDALIVIDVDGFVHDWNHAAEELFQYSSDEVRGRELAEFIIPPEHRAAHRAGLKRFRATGESKIVNRPIEIEAMRRDGTRFAAALTVSRLPGDGPPMFVGAIRDLTRRLEAESERRDIETRYRALMEQLPVVVFIDAADAHLTPLYVSPQIEALLGYTPEEWIGDADLWERSIHPDDRAEVLQRAIESPFGVDFELEYRLLHKNGDVVWVREETVTIFDDNGNPRYSQGVFIDITDRKRDADRLREAETRYRSIVEQAPGITFRSDDPSFSSIDYVSPQLRSILGYEPQDWIDDPDLLYFRIHPDDIPEVDAQFAESVRTGKPLNLEYRQADADGIYHWISLNAQLVGREEGKACFWQGIMTDVTERREMEDAYAALRDRFRHFAEHANDAIIAIDCEGMLLFLNPAFERLVGYSDAELDGRPLATLLNEDSLETAQTVINRLSEDDQLNSERTVVEMLTKEGRLTVVEASVSKLYEHDRIVGYQAILRDVTAQKRLEERLAHQAYHDDLTSLPNRAMLLDQLQSWRPIPLSPGEGKALIFLDLDNFKVINDSLGHEVGDQALIAVGARIRDWLRPNDFVARFGGDEFVVLLNDGQGLAPVEEVAERLVRLFDDPFLVAGREIKITASFGIAELSQDIEHPEDLLRRADIAMYRSKARGRNRFAFHNREMDRIALDRLDLESDLRLAIDRDELSVVYQPFISLASRQITGVEALVRWEHPTRGLLSPADFIPIAEESGLIVDLDRWMLRTALQEVQSWPGIAPEGRFHLSVNVSARQLDEPDFASVVDQILSSNGADSSIQLVLELTETAMMQEPEQARTTLSKLNAKGVRMALDDFGMGYSSLAQIRHLPIDYIKIDRQFTSEICDRNDDRVIVSGMIELSHALGLSVVAEGVETLGQANILDDLNCDFAQGYFYGQPAPSAVMSARLGSNPGRTHAEAASIPLNANDVVAFSAGSYDNGE